MDDSEDLLLELPLNSKQYNHIEVQQTSPRIPERVSQMFEQYRLNLMTDVNQQNDAYLKQLHQYYDSIIVELKDRIHMLEMELSRTNQLLQQREKLQQYCEIGSPQHKSALKQENHSPATINFALEDEQEEFLLDNFPTHNKPTYPAPKMVQSIFLDSLEQPTTHKKEQRNSMHKSVTPITLLKHQFDEGKSYQGLEKEKKSRFEDELKVIKSELLTLRQALAREGIRVDINDANKEDVIPKPVTVQLFEIQESRHVKEHLTNENIIIRKRIQLYKQQLSSIGPELSSLKQLLASALQELDIE